jgi:NADPH-dependent ferric siderophore reductase
MTTDTSPTSEGADVPPPRRRRVMRRVRVTRVEQLSPRMVRVTFTGDDLGAFAWNGPAAHIKLIFPEDGQTEPLMPQPDGPRSTRMRTYTPRRFDPAVPELDVEFVLHAEGRKDYTGLTWHTPCCTPDWADARQAIVTRQANAGGVGASERFTP